MFWSLKNRIKEETGNDVDMIPPIVNNNQSKVIKEKQSDQGSTTNLGSFTIDGHKDESSFSHGMDMKLADGKVITPKEFKKLESKEDEWRRKLQKKEEEALIKLKKVEDSWKKVVEDKEKEMREEIDKREADKKNLEKEKSDLMLKIMKLEESEKKALDYKKKVCQYQEDIDQLEGFQTQEMAKVKHLLLVKEQELLEKEKLIKDSDSLIKSLKEEMGRLRNYEQMYEKTQVGLKDDLETFRHNFDLEKAQLSSKLAEKEEDIRHLKDKVSLLEERANSGPLCDMTVDERVRKLLGERALFERRLEEAHLHLSQIKSSWSSKIESLETQVGRLCRQASEESAEKRQAELERDLSKGKVSELEEELEKVKAKSLSKDGKIEKLTLEKNALEEEIRKIKARREADVQSLQEEIKSTNVNVTTLKDELDLKIKETEEKESLINELKSALAEEKKVKSVLKEEINKLEKIREEEKNLFEALNGTMEKEKREKDEMMMRNAEVSQEAELTRQQLKKQATEVSELLTKMGALEQALSQKQKDLETLGAEKKKADLRIEELEKIQKEQECSSSKEKDLKVRMMELENELFEKNKNVKILQQRLSDMKKTLQRELKVPKATIDPGGTDSDGFAPCYASNGSPNSGGGAAILHLQATQPSAISPRRRTDETCEHATDDVNFKYLKHVLMKFLTSRECEAQHLTRAVATLLRFSAEEERLLKETLEWKMSWFGTKPDLGNGQTSKTIPPS